MSVSFLFFSGLVWSGLFLFLFFTRTILTILSRFTGNENYYNTFESTLLNFTSFFNFLNHVRGER